MHRAESLPPGEYLTLPATELARRFVTRSDLYAQQRPDGRYICMRKPLLPNTVTAHLRGEISLGVYVLDERNLTRYVVLDADAESQWQMLLHAARDLQRQGVPMYCETSRRGGHCWLFFAQAIPGAAARRFAHGLVEYYGVSHVELFPKQDQLDEGPGSLIRLPFGVHLKSGRRYGFVTPDGVALAPTLHEQISLLAAAQTVPNRLIAPFMNHSSTTTNTADFGIPEAVEGTLSARIKAAVSVRTFVENYVELSARGTGMCPFHDDQHPSFSVNDAENYWHCFACGSGGSIIDFWMCYRDCTFKAAVRELAQMLKL